MKKPFNLRLPVLFAASLCGGILYSTVLAYFRLSGTFILIPSLTAFAVCVPVALIKGSASKPLIIIIATLFFLAGAICLYVIYASYGGVPAGVSVRVSGRVERTGETSDGNVYLILSDVKVNGERISGKLAAYMTENAAGNCRRGYEVEFFAELKEQNFFEYGSVSYNACRNVRYVCTVAGYNSTYRFNLFGEMNYALERALFDNLDKETAAVCFAMLTGNTDAISEGTLTAFRSGGIAHVFAVSGLHIGVIYGALTFVFRKCGVNRYVSTAIRIAALCLYAGVCLFSASSVRALVMCSVAAVSGCVHRKSDGLNALAFAAVILLLINPLNLYSVGFKLSFSAVLGILLLSKNLARLLKFLPKKFAGALAVAISVQFSTLPVQLTSFGYVSAAGLALNIVFIPLVSVLYVLLFICAVASAVFPWIAGVLLTVAAVPLQLLMNLVTVCGFEKALVYGRFTDAVYLPFIVAVVIFTDKFNFRPTMRIACACAALFILPLAPFVPNSGKAYATVEFNAGYGGGCLSITTEYGSVLVVTENFRPRSGVFVKADVLVVLGDYDSLSVVTDLGGDYEIIYMRRDAFPLPSLGDTPIRYTDEFTDCGVSFVFDGNAVTATVYSTRISLVYSEKEYAAGGTGSDFELYCHANYGAVLYGDGGDYDLSFCGAMSFEITRGGYNSSNVVPKE